MSLDYPLLLSLYEAPVKCDFFYSTHLKYRHDYEDSDAVRDDDNNDNDKDV